jgi:hypothetical protein
MKLDGSVGIASPNDDSPDEPTRLHDARLSCSQAWHTSSVNTVGAPPCWQRPEPQPIQGLGEPSIRTMSGTGSPPRTLQPILAALAIAVLPQKSADDAHPYENDWFSDVRSAGVEHAYRPPSWTRGPASRGGVRASATLGHYVAGPEWLT